MRPYVIDHFRDRAAEYNFKGIIKLRREALESEG